MKLYRRNFKYFNHIDCKPLVFKKEKPMLFTPLYIKLQDFEFEFS